MGDGWPRLGRGARTAMVAAALWASVAPVAGARHVAAASLASRFQPGTPCRLADVRDGTGFERVDDETVRIDVTDHCGVPEAATAVALTVTVDNTLTPGPGYVSIWPEGAEMPTASIVNYRVREIRANA